MKEILVEARWQVDAAEDELYGDKRGDELPEQLTTEHGRRAWFPHERLKRRLMSSASREARPILQSRPKRLKESSGAWRRARPNPWRTRPLARRRRVG